MRNIGTSRESIPSSLMYDSTRPTACTFLLSIFIRVPLSQHFASIIHSIETKLAQPQENRRACSYMTRFSLEYKPILLRHALPQVREVSLLYLLLWGVLIKNSEVRGRSNTREGSKKCFFGHKTVSKEIIVLKIKCI
jgi:hypothetical protein